MSRICTEKSSFFSKKISNLLKIGNFKKSVTLAIPEFKRTSVIYNSFPVSSTPEQKYDSIFSKVTFLLFEFFHLQFPVFLLQKQVSLVPVLPSFPLKRPPAGQVTLQMLWFSKNKFLLIYFNSIMVATLVNHIGPNTTHFGHVSGHVSDKIWLYCTTGTPLTQEEKT